MLVGPGTVLFSAAMFEVRQRSLDMSCQCQRAAPVQALSSSLAEEEFGKLLSFSDEILIGSSNALTESGPG